MKECPECSEEKDLSEFGKSSKNADGLQAWCKSCKKAYGQAHYQKDKTKYAARARESQARLRGEIHSIKESSPCSDCDKFYPYFVMQFDHIGSDKVANVNTLVSQGAGRDKILAEIDKCELVCANCHCYRTHKRSNN